MPTVRYAEWKTDEGQRKLREMVAEGLSDRQIAEKIGVTRQLLSKWRHDIPEIADALTRYVDAETHKPITREELLKGRDSRCAFNAVSELKHKVEAFFIDEEKRGRVPTMTDLYKFLGISADTFSRYLHNTDIQSTEYITDPITGEYTPITLADVLKSAKQSIEAELVQRLVSAKTTPVGIIFILKNHYNYVDAKEINSNVVEKREKPKDEKDLEARIAELIAKRDRTKIKLVKDEHSA